MDYKEKKYEQAFLRAKKLKETCDSNAVVGWMEYIFPELKESEDEKIRKALINHFRCVFKNGDTVWTNLDYDKVIAWLEKQGEQKPAWSEEDEKMLNDILMCGEHHCYLDAGNIDWLKNLKDRVQSQPKQEWDEEDRKIIIELIGIFESAVDGGHVAFPYRLIKDYIRVLKSCLSQNTWKPSDEQMEALDFAADCIVPAEFCFKRRVLKELFEQLKKLK